MLSCEQCLTANFKATQDKDIDAVMATIHPMSPIRGSDEEELPPLFEQYDLEYEIISYSFVSTSGKYVIARVKQRTSKVRGPAFRDNILDVLVIFKQEGLEWKIWTQTILEVVFETQTPVSSLERK